MKKSQHMEKEFEARGASEAVRTSSPTGQRAAEGHWQVLSGLRDHLSPGKKKKKKHSTFQIFTMASVRSNSLTTYIF